MASGRAAQWDGVCVFIRVPTDHSAGGDCHGVWLSRVNLHGGCWGRGVVGICMCNGGWVQLDSMGG